MRTRKKQLNRCTPAPEGIVFRRPDDLRPWQGNARVHSDKQRKKLEASR